MVSSGSVRAKNSTSGCATRRQISTLCFVLDAFVIELNKLIKKKVNARKYTGRLKSTWIGKQHTAARTFTTVNDYAKVAVALPEEIHAWSSQAPFTITCLMEINKQVNHDNIIILKKCELCARKCCMFS